MASLDQLRQRYPSARDLTDNELIAKLSEITETPYEQVAARFGFDQKTSRGFFGAANDYAIEAANAAAGLAKGVTDFVSPGNAVGQFIQENIIEPGEASQSVPATLAKRQLQRGLQSDEIMPQLGAVASYVGQNPLLAASQAVGSFGPIGGALKGAQAASTLAGLGARGAARVGLGTSAALSGAAAGGDAGSAAYDLVMSTPWETVSRHPQAIALIDAGANQDQVYEELATRAARNASVVPAIIGAVSGATGAESALASGVKGWRGVGKKVAAETLGETFEEGTTQYAGQAAAQEYNPSINPMQGVVGAGTLGGALGAMVATPISIASMEKDLMAPTEKPRGLTAQTEPQGEPPRLGFSPLAGTPVVFPDGSVALGSEQELLKRYGANQTTTALGLNQPYINGDLVTSPGGNVSKPVGDSSVAEPMDLTVANPAQAAASAKLARDPRSAELRDKFGVVPTPSSLQFYSEIDASGVPLASDLLVPVWKYASDKTMTPHRLVKARQLLDTAIIEARKGTTNVGQTTTPISQPTTSVGTGGALVQGGLGTAGPSITSNIQPSTGTTVTGTTTGQTQSTPTTGGQQAAPVTQGLTNGSQAPKAKQAETQGQTTTAKRATGASPIILEKPIEVDYAEDEDALEIARLTGAKGLASAFEGDLTGQRADATPLSDADVDNIVNARFAKSKNAERDVKILKAYLTAMRADPAINKAALQKTIGDKYGIGAVTVRDIGNPSKLIEAGDALGFTAEQVMELFQFNDNTKSQITLIGSIENRITALRKEYSQAKTNLRRERVAMLLSRLSERITKLKDAAAAKADTAFSSGLQDAGIVSGEGETAGFGDDLNREWTRIEAAGQSATALTKYLNAIESAQQLVEQYEEQGQGEAAQAVREQITGLQEKIAGIVKSVSPAKGPNAAFEGAADLVEAEPEVTLKEQTALAKAKEERQAQQEKDRKGLVVGDTVVNPKLGTGTVLSFSGNGAETFVKVEFLNGQTKDLSVQAAKLEKTNAVQVKGATSVSVQPKAEAGQGVGQEVRSTEKPTSKGEVAVLTPQEQYEKVTAGFPVPAWTDLTQSQQSKLTDLARRDQLNLAAVNRFVAAQVTDESNTIDVEARVIDETVKPQVAKLAAPQIDRLEKHYGVGRDTQEFLTKVKDDIVLYVNKGASAVAGAIRDVIKAMAEGVLAVALVFNPNANLDRFEFNVQQVIEQTAEVRAEVPVEAAAKMSSLAKDVYSRVAPAALESGKGFIVADKPNGMIHVFTSKGKVIVQDTALFGKVSGDVMTGEKITPAGKFTMKAQKWDDYAGGFTLDLWTSKGEFEGIAVHAAYLGVASENRISRLATPTAADNKISGGCINTAHDTFIEKIIPNLGVLDGGMLFVLPDNQETTAELFPAQTKTTKTPVQSTKTAGVDRTQVGKEEKMMFGKDAAKPVKTPYTAKELLADIKDFVRSDIPGRKLMVVNSVDDLLTSKDENVVAVGAALKLEGAYGVAADGRAFLIADRINKGNGRAAFMHEVGAHLGLENLLPKALYDKLTAQLEKWVNSNEDTDEAILAARAEVRVMAANTPAEDIAAERLAYFIEEAVLAGIDPTASGKESAPLAAWFRTLWAAFKVAIRKLGFKTESLTAQDIVDMAFGAARLEISGTFHGTAAAFRKFNHAFMGKGEGAQAFGWGSYFAQAAGVAKGYWVADVRRKTGLTFDGVSIKAAYQQAKDAFNAGKGDPVQLTAKYDALREVLKTMRDSQIAPDAVLQYAHGELKRLAKNDSADGYNTQALKWFEANMSSFAYAKPEGSLMRVDIGVEDQDTLNWDTTLATQPVLLKRLTDNLAPSVREELEDAYNVDIHELTGAELYRGLMSVEDISGIVSEQFDVTDYNNRLRGASTKELVSKYLDEKIGIPALKFLDQNSRGDATAAEAKQKNRKALLGEKLRTLNDLTDYADKWERQYDNAPEQYKAEAKQNWLNAVASRTTFEFQVEQLRQEIASEDKRINKLRNPTRNIVVFNDKNIFRVGMEANADRQRMRFGKAAPDQGFIAKNIAKLPKGVQQPVRNIVGEFKDLSGKYLDYVIFTGDLVGRAVKEGLLSAETFANRLAARNARVNEEERKIEKIADGYANIEDEFKGFGPGTVNEFLLRSTLLNKWGYGPMRDTTLGAEFDALKPNAQKFVKDVFAHGATMLANKKAIVLKATNSEYDAMIAAAQDAVALATDKDTLAKAKATLSSLKAEKAATLKRFQTLFKLREGMPYAPSKRTGAYVVIGKSAQYEAAEKAEDAELIKKLESDPSHFNVSFTDTKWAARTLEAKVAEEYPSLNLNIAKRAEAMDDFRTNSLMPALVKMRSAVENQNTGANGKLDATSSKMLNIINQLYLEALAEGSARKSEMRRRGVFGNVDMLQSFTQQGRADANFLANIEFEPQIQDAIQRMRNESRKGVRGRKSEIFDELTKRYIESLEYKPNSFISGLTNTASKYYLATSPAYYMQNLTQPWMMSLPALAGHHDYVKAGKALGKAYTELGPLFENVKLFDQQFDFSKVPEDVRAAINELVNQGTIDIGLATEINEYKVDADGNLTKFANRLNKGMRLAVQKVEAINRLSTAMAAYRLELERAKQNPKIADPKAAAIKYAAGILTNTHGDYTSFNAPRIFNTSWGKVALQFRKFQLVQIGFYFKLFRDAFTNPQERAAAIRTLVFSISHTAVFAGMMGLPGYAAIAAIIKAFSDDDEPYDLTAEMRQALGPEWSNLIMRGAPTLLNVDLSGKIGAGNMLSIMPFSDADLKTNAGRAEALGTLVGGAALGMTSRVADGLLLMAGGDYYKGVERVMPKGVSDALKAGRQATEGVTRRNGDLVLSESEIGSLETVFTALGVPSAKQAVVYERQNRMRDITENFQDRTTRIKNDYAKAVRQGDTEAMAEARAAWTKLQQARQRNGLTIQPMSNLLKAPKEQRDREKRTVGGVAYRQGQRRLAESIANDTE